MNSKPKTIGIIATTAGLGPLIRHLEGRTHLAAPIEMPEVDSPPTLFPRKEPDMAIWHKSGNPNAAAKARCGVCHEMIPVSISGTLAVHAIGWNTLAAGPRYHCKGSGKMSARPVRRSRG